MRNLLMFLMLFAVLFVLNIDAFRSTMIPKSLSLPSSISSISSSTTTKMIPSSFPRFQKIYMSINSEESKNIKAGDIEGIIYCHQNHHHRQQGLRQGVRSTPGVSAARSQRNHLFGTPLDTSLRSEE